MPGSTAVSTSFLVPSNIESGPSTLQVIANGIASLYSGPKGLGLAKTGA